MPQPSNPLLDRTSETLFAEAQRYIPGGVNSPVRAFTIGIEGEGSDESPDASAYAREIGVAHTIEHVTPAKALTMLDDVVASCGEPFADYSIFPTMLIARLARQHVKVMLSGDGGDELFWGYAARFASVIEKSATFRPQPCWSRSFRRGFARLLHPDVVAGFQVIHLWRLGAKPNSALVALERVRWASNHGAPESRSSQHAPLP